MVRFGHQDSKTSVRPLVIVRTKEGVERQLMVSTRNTLIHCHKGSRIRLVRQGNALFVDQRGCGRVRVETPSAPVTIAMSSTGWLG